jgi:hypothetical protein
MLKFVRQKYQNMYCYSLLLTVFAPETQNKHYAAFFYIAYGVVLLVSHLKYQDSVKNTPVSG